MRHREDVVGARQRAPREKQAPGLHRRGEMPAGGAQHVAQVVHGDHQPRRHHGRRVEPGHVQHIHAALAQQPGQVQVRVKGPGLVRVFEQLEICGQRIEFLEVPAAGRSAGIRESWSSARKLVDDVADVGAEAVVAGAADIDGHAHRCAALSARCRGSRPAIRRDARQRRV